MTPEAREILDWIYRTIDECMVRGESSLSTTVPNPELKEMIIEELRANNYTVEVKPHNLLFIFFD